MMLEIEDKAQLENQIKKNKKDLARLKKYQRLLSGTDDGNWSDESDYYIPVKEGNFKYLAEVMDWTKGGQDKWLNVIKKQKSLQSSLSSFFVISPRYTLYQQVTNRKEQIENEINLLALRLDEVDEKQFSIEKAIKDAKSSQEVKTQSNAIKQDSDLIPSDLSIESLNIEESDGVIELGGSNVSCFSDKQYGFNKEESVSPSASIIEKGNTKANEVQATIEALNFTTANDEENESDNNTHQALNIVTKISKDFSDESLNQDEKTQPSPRAFKSDSKQGNSSPTFFNASISDDDNDSDSVKTNTSVNSESENTNPLSAYLGDNGLLKTYLKQRANTYYYRDLFESYLALLLYPFCHYQTSKSARESYVNDDLMPAIENYINGESGNKLIDVIGSGIISFSPRSLQKDPEFEIVTLAEHLITLKEHLMAIYNLIDVNADEKNNARNDFVLSGEI